MRCPRCQFENMPGLDRCFQCGSALQAGPDPVEIQPPRMAGWKRLFRNLLRRGRGWHLIPETWRLPRLPEWFRNWTGESYLGILLSVIPGLAHLIQKRFGSVRRWIAIWAVMLLLAVCFFGGFGGMLFLGLALGAHAWIACNAGFFQEHENLAPRFTGIIAVSIVLYMLYGVVWRMALDRMNIVSGYSGVTVPFHQVDVGDFLLARHSVALPNNLQRGSLAAVNLRGVAGGRNHHLIGNRPVLQMVEIIGLPGERVELKDNQFRINGQTLDPEIYPVPGWLNKRSFSVTIPTGSYFVAAEYRGIRFTDQDIIRVSTISFNQIEGKAILRWSPVLKRGWIRDPE